MPRFLVMVKHDDGTAEAPMDQWDSVDVEAHLRYYDVLQRELIESGEQVRFIALGAPQQAKVVRTDGSPVPVVSDGPFAETKELIAGFQIVDVESKARAIEIAARVSAAPGPGGVPLQQMVEVREVVVDS